MGLFNKKTAEEKQAAKDAKYDKAMKKAEGKFEREQKVVGLERKAQDSANREHTLYLMETGVDVREATDVIRAGSLLGTEKVSTYVATMPEAVVVYTVAGETSVSLKNKITPVKNVQTIPYTSIHTVDVTSGLIKSTLTFATSGESFDFETTDGARFIAETINAKKAGAL